MPCRNPHGLIARDRQFTITIRIAINDELLAIRDAQMSWAKINQWRLALHQQFDRALETTPLRDRPDYEAANAFLIHARAQQAQAYLS